MIFNILGNPVDGFQLHGPFESIQDASDWQEGCDESCWVIESELANGFESPKVKHFPILCADEAEATLAFNLTDEGLIVDLIENDEVIDTYGSTAQEFYDTVFGNKE